MFILPSCSTNAPVGPSAYLCEFLVHCFKVECLWIELPTDPFKQFFMSLMRWVLDGFNEIGVAPGTAAIFGRISSRTRNADWIGHACSWFKLFFHDQLMLPFIAEVILIREPRSAMTRRDNVAQLDSTNVLNLAFHIRFHVRKLDAADLESVKMLKLPSYHYLNDGV